MSAWNRATFEKNTAFATISLGQTGIVTEAVLNRHNSEPQTAKFTPKSNCAIFNFVRLALGVIIILTPILLPQGVRSQESPITATVNKTILPTDELVILTVVLDDDSAQQPRPLLPRLEGLAVIDLDISTSVDIAPNGNIHTQVTYVYRLQPRRTGLLTIPPIAVKIDEQIYKTPPISINVTQGSPPAPSPENESRPEKLLPPSDLAGQDFFVEADVNQLTPYVSQQIIHTFRFYQALQLYREPQYEAPRFAGFETMGLPVREYNVEVDGRTYLVTEIRTALFPQNSGKIIIRSNRLMLPGNYYEEPVDMYTDPITVEVTSWPDGAPVGFNGVVGQYEIKAWVSPQIAVAHQPTTLFAAISGTGNIQTMPDPIWPELSGWRAYNTLSSLTTDTQEDGSINGTRVFEQLIVPDQVGDFTISPVRLVYFDPVAAEYRTISSEALPVQVIPQPTPAALTPTSISALPTATAESISMAPAISPSGEDEVNPAFLDLPGLNTRLTLPLLLLFVGGICVLAPVAAVAGAGGLWWWQRRQTRPPEEATKDTLKQPNTSVHPSLAAAMKHNNDNYKAVALALNAYLQTVLKIPVTGLTHSELVKALREYGLDEALVVRIRDCLAQSEMGRYGPVTEDAGWSLMVETDELLFELDEVTGK